MTKNELSEILVQLRTASLSLSPDATEEEVHALMQKYDMLFLGKNYNTIYSIELCHMLKTKKKIDVSLDELNGIIPEACAALGMKFNSLINISDAGKPNPNILCYSIELY